MSLGQRRLRGLGIQPHGALARVTPSHMFIGAVAMVTALIADVHWCAFQVCRLGAGTMGVGCKRRAATRELARGLHRNPFADRAADEQSG